MLRILSLGAGVQSSTLALLFATGEIDVPLDGAIFADTGAEPASVYAWLDWLEGEIARSARPYPVYRVMRDEGLERAIFDGADGKRLATPPFFTSSPDGQGQLRRQCTRDFKVDPIHKKLRELLGLKPGQRAPSEIIATQYIGISWDEVQRMKPAREHWIVHQWPLIDRAWTRGHCLEWMAAKGYPTPPRSACYFCPYKSDAEWQRLRDTEPEEWYRAIAIDRVIRDGIGGTKERLYLHRSLRPLPDVDLRTAKDFGQVDAFGNECEGMCGV